MIGIGVHTGGPELSGSPIRYALMKAMLASRALRAPNYDDGTEAWINPICTVPGSVWQPDFESYKLGHFSRKKKGLVVEIVVPQAVANGEGIIEFIGASLREAVRLAAAHFASKGIPFSTLKVEKIIIGIENELQKSG